MENNNIYILNLDSCNQRCLFCMKVDDLNNNNHIKELADVKKEIFKAKENGYQLIDFFGGEPTVFSFLSKSISLAQKNGMLVMLATNGVKFSSKEYATNFFKEIDSQKITFRVSMHSQNHGVHDYITQLKGSHKRTETGILNILNYVEKLTANIVITSLNFKELSKIVQYLHGLGVKGVKFSALQLQGEILKNKRLIVDYKEFRKYLLEAVLLSKKLKFKSIEIEKINKSELNKLNFVKFL